MAFPYSSIKVISETTGKSKSTVRRWVEGMRSCGRFPPDCVIFTSGRTMLVNNNMLIKYLKGGKEN